MPDASDRLDSWKQIAAYFAKSERTVRRWQESEGLPVHKHPHQQRGSVWAYRQELDAWLEERRISPPPVGDATPRGSHPRGGRLVAGVAVIVVVAAGGVLSRHSIPPVTLPDPIPVTALPGVEYGASVSPDGKRVAFFWESPNWENRGIYVQSLDSGELTPLVRAPRGSERFDYNPVWSPDGETIAFLRREDGDTWLCLIASSGGADRRLIRLLKQASLLANNQHLSWSLDGLRILAPAGEGGLQKTIRWISVADGSTQRVSEPALSAYAPALSPDGRAFVYLRKYGPRHTDEPEVLLQKLKADGSTDGPPLSIYRGQSLLSGIAWAPGGADLVFCNAETRAFGPRASRLYRMPARPGGQMTPIGGTGCNTVTVSRPRYGGLPRLIYGCNRGPRAKLWQASLAALRDASEFAPSSRFDGFPVFSPDGSSVAFVSTRAGDDSVWIANRDGTQVRRLLDESSLGAVQSPDSGHTTAGSPGLGLAVAPVTAGPAPGLPVSKAEPRWFYWSHIRDLVYRSPQYRQFQTRPSGSSGTRPDDYRKEPVVCTSPDGKTLYMARNFGLYRRLAGQEKEELIEADLLIHVIAASRTAIYYVRRDDRALHALPFVGGPARKIGVLPGFEHAPPRQLEGGFTVSPDDSRIVWSLSDPPEIDLEMVPDFR